MSDKMLTCRDCGAEFVFTESEQAFYAEKGFTNEPSRCPSCRAARKASGGGGGGGYSSRPREMHTTTCSSCGKEAQVPFVPRGDRPVYCSDCFSSQRASSSRY
jgi:CxxC-x17-CxxC domain-containing protein